MTSKLRDLKYEPAKVRPAMCCPDRRPGAGSCTIRSQRRQDFLPGRSEPLHLAAIKFQQFADILTHHAQIAHSQRSMCRDQVHTSRGCRLRHVDGRRSAGAEDHPVPARLTLSMGRFNRPRPTPCSKSFIGQIPAARSLRSNLSDDLPEGQLCNFRDPQAEWPEQLVVDPQCSPNLWISAAKPQSRLHMRGIIRGGLRSFDMHNGYHNARDSAIKTKRFSLYIHPQRAAARPNSGLRQSMPSHTHASCADRQTGGPPRSLQAKGKRPRSRTL